MKRNIALVLTLLMILGLLTGCGGAASSTEKYAADAPAAEAPAAPMPEPEMMYGYEMGVTEESMDAMEANPNTAAGGLGDGTAAPADVARKLIRNVDLSLETREFDQAVADLNDLVARLGGYIEYSDISGRSLDYKGEYYRRNAHFVARIPAEKLSEAEEKSAELAAQAQLQ